MGFFNETQTFEKQFPKEIYKNTVTVSSNNCNSMNTTASDVDINTNIKLQEAPQHQQQQYRKSSITGQYPTTTTTTTIETTAFSSFAFFRWLKILFGGASALQNDDEKPKSKSRASTSSGYESFDASCELESSYIKVSKFTGKPIFHLFFFFVHFRRESGNLSYCLLAGVFHYELTPRANHARYA